MLEFLTLAGRSAVSLWLTKDVLGPLTKSAAEDFYKDFLKRSVSEALAQNASKPMKKAIAESIKEFLNLFQEELEYCGWGALIKHEFAKPLQQLLDQSDVRRELGRAFDTDVKRLDWQMIEKVWASLSTSSLPPDYDW